MEHQTEHCKLTLTNTGKPLEVRNMLMVALVGLFFPFPGTFLSLSIRIEKE